ncbi:MAG TPA: Hsp20/alpha crystallin family protein [Arenicellales bacterium]|nr:Hsp20/alpha crystallin family protein [Arenicellales bacterium]
MFRFANSIEGGPFEQFRRLERELDELLGRWRMPGSGIRAVAADTFPPLNVGQTDDRVDVYLFAPGVDPKQVEVSVQGNLLTVSGERHIETSEGATWYRRERHDGEFRRAVTLPEDADPDKVNAVYRDGVLHITVARREAARPRRVEIQ